MSFDFEPYVTEQCGNHGGQNDNKLRMIKENISESIQIVQWMMGKVYEDPKFASLVLWEFSDKLLFPKQNLDCSDGQAAVETGNQ